MISIKLPSKKAVLGVIILAFAVTGIVIYVFSLKKFVENTSRLEFSQPASNTTSILREETESITDNNQTSGKIGSTESFTYSEDDQLFVVSEKEFRVLDKISVENLISESEECGTKKNDQYFNSVLSKYSIDDKGVEYSFKYKGKTQDSGIWKVTVVPNKIGYDNLDNFKNDFDLCKAGAEMYPTLISEKWLLFESSCGTGFDDDSGNPHGCDVVQQAVGPTITLK